MHHQLRVLKEEFDAAQARLHRLVTVAAEPVWTRRAEPTRWSMAESVAHLNLTSAAYLPLLDAAIGQGRRLGGPPPRRYRRDPVGWLLWRLSGPPVRYRTRTTAPFVPAATMPLPDLVAEFDRWQAALLDRLAAADGLRLGQVWITSPFDSRIRYNAYATLTILPRHQHRHLWQAEQVLAALTGGPARIEATPRRD